MDVNESEKNGDLEQFQRRFAETMLFLCFGLGLAAISLEMERGRRQIERVHREIEKHQELLREARQLYDANYQVLQENYRTYSQIKNSIR